jgi:hypothetical protein
MACRVLNTRARAWAKLRPTASSKIISLRRMLFRNTLYALNPTERFF